MNRHPTRMPKKLRKHAAVVPCPSSHRSFDEAGGEEGGISPSAARRRPKKTNAGRKSWDYSDSDDSLSLAIEFAKGAIDRGSWKDGCGSSDDDNSSSSSNNNSVGGVGASHFEKGTRTMPTATSKNNATDTKKRGNHIASVGGKAISRSSLIKVSNAGKREHATPYNFTGSDLARTGKIRTQSQCWDNANLFIRLNLIFSNFSYPSIDL